MDVQSVELFRRDGRAWLIIDHDKGRSIYVNNDEGDWVPIDEDSIGAMDDLIPDLPERS